MVERLWELVHVSSLDIITDNQTDRSSEWLMSMSHSPHRIIVDKHRIVCMTKANQITISRCSLSHKLMFPLPEHIIPLKVPVTCIKAGFSHTLGINFIGTYYI